MEKEVFVKVIEAFKEMTDTMKKLLVELEKDVNSLEAADPAPKSRKKKDAPAVPGTEAAPPPAEEKKPGVITVADVTIEMLREMATKYSTAFGMPKLLELNLKHGGVKKLKDLDKGIYGVLYGAMSDELAKAATPAPEGAGAVTPAKPEGITKDKLREAAAQFIAANGEPALHAVLKAFGAHKISEIAADKYPAFLEAISNA